MQRRKAPRTRRRYYSQCGEDFLLWTLFGDQPAGYFVDIGAYDGIYFSNTYSFEQCSWRGICVEPHPAYFPCCQQVRPQSVCLNVACIGNPAITETTFYIEEMGRLSSTLPGREAYVSAMYARWRREFKGLSAIRVPPRTLNDILRQHLPPRTPIDFVSIDVEGTELDTLRGFDLLQYLPRVVVVEADTDLNRRALSDYMKKTGRYQADSLQRPVCPRYRRYPAIEANHHRLHHRGGDASLRAVV